MPILVFNLMQRGNILRAAGERIGTLRPEAEHDERSPDTAKQEMERRRSSPSGPEPRTHGRATRSCSTAFVEYYARTPRTRWRR
jgi:hypothetical protein